MEKRTLYGLLVAISLIGTTGLLGSGVLLFDNQDLNSQLQGTADDYEQLLSEHKELNNSYNDLLSQYDMLLDIHDTLINEYTAVTSQYNMAMSTLNETIEDCKILNQTYQDLILEYESLNSTYYILTGDHLDLNSTHYELIDQHEQLNQTYYGLVANYELLESQNNTLTILYSELLQNHQTLQNERDELLENLNILLEDFNTLQSSYTTLESDFQSLESDYFVLSDEYDTLLQTYQILDQTYQQLVQSNQELQQNYLFLSISYVQLNQDYSQLNAEYDLLESDYQLLNSSYTTLTIWISQQIFPVQYCLFAEAVRRYYEPLYLDGITEKEQYMGFVEFCRDVVLHDSNQYNAFSTVSDALSDALVYGSDTMWLSWQVMYWSFWDWLPFWGVDLTGIELAGIDTVHQWCVDTIDYEYDSDITRYQEPAFGDYIKFPVETAFRTMGDCEDQAILDAAYLESCGFETAIAIFHDPDHPTLGSFYHGTLLVHIEDTSAFYSQYPTTSLWTFGSIDPYYGNFTWCWLDPTWDIPFGSNPAWLQDYLDYGGLDFDIMSIAFCDLGGAIG